MRTNLFTFYRVPGAFCDLVWSDPEDVDTWSTSPRGAGWLFGQSVTKEFMEKNSLTLICRAHQLVQEGTDANQIVRKWRKNPHRSLEPPAIPVKVIKFHGIMLGTILNATTPTRFSRTRVQKNLFYLANNEPVESELKKFTSLVGTAPAELVYLRLGLFLTALHLRGRLKFWNASFIFSPSLASVPGYKYMFNEKLVTVWSAPNYCYRCGNVASILEVSADAETKTPKLFEAVPDSQRVIPSKVTTPYFL